MFLFCLFHLFRLCCSVFSYLFSFVCVSFVSCFFLFVFIVMNEDCSTLFVMIHLLRLYSEKSIFSYRCYRLLYVVFVFVGVVVLLFMTCAFVHCCILPLYVVFRCLVRHAVISFGVALVAHICLKSRWFWSQFLDFLKL